MDGHHASTDGQLGVVPPGRPHHVAQLEDVAHPGLRLGEIVDTNLVWHVVPVVPTQYKTNLTHAENRGLRRRNVSIIQL